VQISAVERYRLTDRQRDKQMTDRQSDTTEIIYHAALRVVDKTIFTILNAMLLIIILPF